MPGCTENPVNDAAPVLSFVVPYYNVGASLLRRCLYSLAGQGVRRSDYEVIVVDDGSDDFPHSMLADFPGQVTYIRREHAGPGAARNAGIDAARGEYVQFVDADDYLYTDAVACYLPMLLTKDYDIVSFSFKPVGAEAPVGHVKTMGVKVADYASGADFMRRHNLSGCPWLYAFRRAVADIHGVRFTPSIYHEDEEFNTRLYLYAGRTCQLSLPVYAYCQRAGSITTKRDRAHVEKRLSDFKAVTRRLSDLRAADTALNAVQVEALGRKVNLLVCDYLINLFRLRTAWPRLKSEIASLRQQGLWPLAREHYSLSYVVFRWLAASEAGILLLARAERIRKRLHR